MDTILYDKLSEQMDTLIQSCSMSSTAFFGLATLVTVFFFTYVLINTEFGDYLSFKAILTSIVVIGAILWGIHDGMIYYKLDKLTEVILDDAVIKEEYLKESIIKIDSTLANSPRFVTTLITEDFNALEDVDTITVNENNDNPYVYYTRYTLELSDKGKNALDKMEHLFKHKNIVDTFATLIDEDMEEKFNSYITEVHEFLDKYSTIGLTSVDYSTDKDVLQHSFTKRLEPNCKLPTQGYENMKINLTDGSTFDLGNCPNVRVELGAENYIGVQYTNPSKTKQHGINLVEVNGYFYEPCYAVLHTTPTVSGSDVGVEVNVDVAVKTK